MMALHFLMTSLMMLNQWKIENYAIITSLKSETTGKLINRIPGLHLLISSSQGSASRTHIESLGKPRCQQALSKPCLLNLISKDTHLVFSIYECTCSLESYKPTPSSQWAVYTKWTSDCQSVQWCNCILSHDFTSGSDIISCNKMDKPLRGLLYSKFSYGQVYRRIYGRKFSLTPFMATHEQSDKAWFPNIYLTIYLPKWKFWIWLSPF